MDVLATSFSSSTAQGSDKLEYMRSQAEELEAVFLNTLVSEMFSSAKSDKSEFGGGYAEETWRGMQSEQYAAAMAQSGGIGIADQITRSLISQQEASSSTQNQNSSHSTLTKLATTAYQGNQS